MDGNRYLFWCAYEHLDFRLPEFNALAELFNIKEQLSWVDNTIENPWVIIDLPNEEAALKLISRSISTKYCVQLWADATNYADLHQRVKCFPSNLVEPYCDKEKSFKIYVEAFMKSLTMAERLEKMESFSYIPVRGPVKLQNPDVIFSAFEFYGTDHNNLPEQPQRLFFGRCIGEGQRHLITKLSLKKRLFIGNTSMDPQLSLLMANLAKLKSHHLVLDPFVGTGSNLIAAAAVGAYVMGSDIDYLMVHARTRPSRVGQKKRKSGESFKGNFEQYKLGHKLVDVIVGDAAAAPWNGHHHFDAIVTDPPYGIREPTAKVGSKKEAPDVPEEYQGNHIPQKVEYDLGDIFLDLLDFAAANLVLGGRLVFWIPVNREHYTPEKLPAHPCFKLVANCEQVLSSHTSRRCLVMEKTESLDNVELDSNREARQGVHETAAQFREQFFKAQQVGRLERKERIKKYGHLNMSGK